MAGLGEAGELLGAGHVLGEQGVDRHRRAHTDTAEGLGGDEGGQRAPLNGGDVGTCGEPWCRHGYQVPELDPPPPPPEKLPPEDPKPEPPEEPGVDWKVPVADVEKSSTPDTMLPKSGNIEPW